jgi:hypothetical protein
MAGEETKGETEWKGRTAHEAARWMLEEDPWGYVVTLATMYGGQKTIVPPKEISVLVMAFKSAKKKMIVHIDHAIAALEKQAKEAKEKEEKGKKEG